MLRPFGHLVTTCWEMLRRVGCCWLKFENGQISRAILVDVACCSRRFGQVRATTLHPGMRATSLFNTLHVATCRNRVAKRTQHLGPNSVAICCVEMLRSFGRGLRARESSPTPKNIGRGERPLLRVCHETTARQGSCLVTERCETFSEEFDCYKALFNCKSSLYFVFRRCIFKVTTSN